MAKLTDRYENQNLINLAKDKYEQQQKSTIPSEIVTLTSQGKVYPKNSPLSTGKIEMRYMTAYDEDILTNPSYIKQGVVLNKLIEALIVSDINIDDLAMVDKDGLILAARILSYGSEYPVTVTDPKTNKSLDRTIDLSKIKTKPIEIDSDENGEFSYNYNDINIKWIFPKVYHEFNTISEFLSIIITEINGNRNKSDIDEFIRYKFLITDSKKFQTYVIDNTPSTLLEYDFEGERGGTFKAGFQIGSDFFWPNN